MRVTGLHAFNTLQRVKKAAMPKPDKALRSRPLQEVGAALERLKKVVLFHPDPIVVEMPPKYCVCKQGADRGGDRSLNMVQCVKCYDWFHFDCVNLHDDADVEALQWECKWCLSVADKFSYQRWEKKRDKAKRTLVKRRHVKDTPRHRGVALGEDTPTTFSAPVAWDGKVEEVQEWARRAAIKKRKLTDQAEALMDEKPHHLVDAQGLAGLEMLPVDDLLVDALVGVGLLDENSPESDD